MITVQMTGVKELQAALGDAAHKLPKELAIAVNKTAKAHIKELASGNGPIQSEIVITAKVARNSFYISKKATADSPDAVIDVVREGRTSLRNFKPIQKPKGVTYRISKREPRKLAPSAFIVEKLYNHVFKRQFPYVSTKAGGTKKRNRAIVKLDGISLYGLYKKLNLLEKFSNPAVQARLSKEIESRIRTILFRQSR